jgi:PAS domain S-box-containing protein
MESARILIIDGDPCLLRATGLLLTEAGFRVLEADSGTGGLSMVKEAEPDLVLLGRPLPDMDCTDLCRLLKTEKAPHSFVVFLSEAGRGSDPEPEDLEAGADAYIARPISNEELLERVRLMVRLHRAQAARRDIEEQHISTSPTPEGMQHTRAEEALRRERDLVTRIAETSPASIIVVDRQGQITFANAMAQQVLGLTKDESTRLPLNAANWRITDYAGKHFPEDQLPFRQVLASGQPVHDGRHAIEWPDGKRQLLSINAAPLLDEEGGVSGVVASVEDITERIRAEAALRESEARYRLLVEDQNDMIIRFDTEGRLLFVSPTYCETFGKTADELLGKKFLPLVHEEDRGRIAQTLQELQQEPHSANHEERALTRSGWRWFSWSNRATLDQSGEVREIIGVGRDITQRKLAEDALAASEEKYRTIIESIPVGMHMYRLQDAGNLVFVDSNPAAGRILGVDHKRFVGLTIEEAFPALAETEVPEQYRRVAGMGETWRNDEIVYEEGQIAGAFEVHASQTSPGMMVAAFIDITDRKRAEQMLQESEATLRSIFRVAPIGIGLVSDRVILRVNQRVCEMVGYSREELLGQDVQMLYADLLEYERVDKDKYAQITRWGTGTVETRWRCKQGGVIDVLLSSTPLDRDDLTAGITFSALDITERKQTMDALRQQRREAEALRQTSLVLGAFLDRDQVLDHLLDQIETVIPYDSANVMLIEGGIARITHQRGYELAGTAEATAALRLEVDKVPNLHWMLIERRPHIVSDTWTDPDWVRLEPTGWIRSWAGAPIVVRNETVAFFSMDSRTPGFYTAEHANLLLAFAAHAAIAFENAMLYSEVQMAYEEQKRAQAQLIQSAKLAAVGELAAGVAHEINNPLTSVLGFSELLLRNSTLDGPTRKDLTIIVEEARRARDIVRGLLDFSRQTESFFARVEVNQVLRDTLDLLRRQIKNRNVAIEERYEQGLPELSLAAGRMKQVFLNLITNALNAMPGGGTLSVSSQRLEDEVAMCIGDTGLGIPKEVLPRIFEPFFTTESTGRGTGLGLSVSLGIVQEHGGRITVESQVGVGSIFTVWLPIEPAALEGNYGG